MPWWKWDGDLLHHDDTWDLVWDCQMLKLIQQQIDEENEKEKLEMENELPEFQFDTSIDEEDEEQYYDFGWEE